MSSAGVYFGVLARPSFGPRYARLGGGTRVARGKHHEGYLPPMELLPGDAAADVG